MPDYGNFVDNPNDWSCTDDGTGLLTGTLKRTISVPIGERVTDTALPTKGDTHPFDSRLRYKDHSISYIGNELAVASISYVGLANDPGGITWDWNGPTDENAIDMHPDFPSWGTIRGTTAPTAQDRPGKMPEESQIYSDKFGTVNWNHENVEVDSQQKFSYFRTVKEMKILDLPGVKGYKVPRATLRVNFSTAKTSGFTWAVSQLGYWFDSIPISEVENEIPTTVSPKNWLLTSVSVSAFAQIYKVQVEFTLSGEKGWNKLIYRKAGGNRSPNSSLAPPGGWPTKLASW